MSDLVTLAKDKRAASIAAINDAFRTTFQGGRVMITAGINALPDMVRAAALKDVADFNDFDGTNDPFGEHDFGAFTLCGRLILWKIEYYNEDMTAASDDPLHFEKTTRVLTILLAEEF